MRSFSKLGLTLLLFAVFAALSLLCLAVTLLCFLGCRQRRQKQPVTGDTELGCKGACFKESTVLNFLCCKIRSRVEPAGDSPVLCSSSGVQVKIPAAELAEEEVDEECALAMWRAVAFGPSRVLYTIKEEEREGSEFEEKEEDDLFATPCESPLFYTPASSPARAPEKEVIVAVWVSPPAPADGGLGIS